MTTKTKRHIGLMAAGMTAVAALVAGPQLATAAQRPPEVPGNIAVPAGHVLSSMGAAEGFQIYGCQSTGWVLQQPQAVLLAGGHKPFALHYGGPTWTAMDGSSVVGARVDGVPAPSPSDIPWLLLRATPKPGAVEGALTGTTYIQRLNTSGGVAPATGCDADHLGATTLVPYTADYFFFRAA